MKTRSLLVSAAFSGLIMAGSANGAEEKKADATGETPKEVTGECHGVNGCKGTGACGGKGHSCAGKNECKGKGWEKMTQSECKEKGGKFKKG